MPEDRVVLRVEEGPNARGRMAGQGIEGDKAVETREAPCKILQCSVARALKYDQNDSSHEQRRCRPCRDGCLGKEVAQVDLASEVQLIARDGAERKVQVVRDRVRRRAVLPGQ